MAEDPSAAIQVQISEIVAMMIAMVVALTTITNQTAVAFALEAHNSPVDKLDGSPSPIIATQFVTLIDSATDDRSRTTLHRNCATDHRNSIQNPYR